jgi:hypothetical protein
LSNAPKLPDGAHEGGYKSSRRNHARSLAAPAVEPTSYVRRYFLAWKNSHANGGWAVVETYADGEMVTVHRTTIYSLLARAQVPLSEAAAKEMAANLNEAEEVRAAVAQ